MKPVLQKKLAKFFARMASRLWPECPELFEFYKTIIMDQAVHGRIITRVDPAGVAPTSISDKELIKKLARRIHNQRVVLRQDWNRVHQNIAYFNWLDRRGKKDGIKLRIAQAKIKIIEQQYFHSIKEREDERFE